MKHLDSAEGSVNPCGIRFKNQGCVCVGRGVVVRSEKGHSVPLSPQPPPPPPKEALESTLSALSGHTECLHVRLPELV